jgi:APA family basic amino acid/polyamine antiporter
MAGETLDTSNSRALPRSLGLWAAIAVVVSNVIGSGIFTTSGFLAQDLGDPSLLLFSWILGGVLAMAGALTYGELGARIPKAGGEYVFLREGYGPLPAFLTGWASFWAGFSAPIAAAAIAFVEHLSFFYPSLAVESEIELATSWADRIGPGHFVAIGAIVLISLIHRRTAKVGARFHVGITGVKVALISLLILGGITWGRGDVSHFRSIEPIAWEGSLLILGGITWGRGDVSHFRSIEPIAWEGAFPGLAVGLIFVMFSFSGWNAAAYIGEEIKNPRRNLPLSLIVGTIVVGIIYMGLNAVYIYAMPIEDMKGVLRVGEMATQKLFSGTAAPFLNILFMATILGSVSAMVIAGPRVYFAMARDGLFPSAIARIHPRFKTPSTAIVLQALWASLLVLSGTFEQLVTFSTVILLIFTGWTVTSLFVIRKKTPDFDGYRTWGYPFTPILFLSITGWSVIYTLFNRPSESLIGIGFCAVGVLAYYLLRRRRQHAE